VKDERSELTTADLAGRREDDDARDEPIARDTHGERRTGTHDDEEIVPLFRPDEAARFRATWVEIQTGFVDRPREAVERADGLVADLMQRLAAQFSEERSGLESQWDGGDDVSTEDLRVALTRYRSFFERLLTA
jgi:hypothetical protein